MPYTKEHKQRTRQRILKAAARAFRTEGIAGVSVPAVMQSAGLTHGGFYAHFASKDALVAEACGAGFSDAAERLFDEVAQMAPDDALQAIVRAYLSRTHRDHPETGCILPALAAEVTHSAPEVRAGFTEAALWYAQRLAAYLPAHDTTPEQLLDEALVLLSGMAGALQLARAVDDPALSDQILRSARAFYLAALARPFSQ
ncbi:MAG TPA: TetR/AcrR family transcriptional regulator [Ktedonobacterales bacterium]|nr:TetR/AcrR family transcriptional regulator [Ktedonobacterales bacterium]